MSTRTPVRPTGRAARQQPVDQQHRATRTVLVVGSLLALAAAAGPLWVVRAGLVVAVVTTVLTAVLAGRELTAARRENTRRLLFVDKKHGDQLRVERRRNGEVVDALSERLRSTGMVVAGQRSTIATLRGEVGVLTVERDGLREQVAERDGLIGLFRTSLREQEAALLAVREAERTNPPVQTRTDTRADAEIHALPRRSRPSDPVTDSVLDPEMAELAMVLPNYEATRRAV